MRPRHLAMLVFAERMRPYRHDPSRFDTYLEQLGITYPTVRRPPPLDQRSRRSGSGT